MSDLLKNIQNIANDPFKAGTSALRGALGKGPEGSEEFSSQFGNTNTNINEFRDLLFRDGIQRTNRFQLVVMVPEFVTSGMLNGNDIPRELSLKCGQVTVPTKTVVQKEMQAFGTPYKPGENFEYGELSATFVLGKNHRELIIFNEWMNNVYSNKDGRAGYYKDYISPRVFLYTLDERDNQTYVYIFEEVFPISIDTSDFSNEEQNGFSSMTVGLGYRRFLGNNQVIASKEIKEDGFLGTVSDTFKNVSKTIGALDNGFAKLESLKNKFK